MFNNIDATIDDKFYFKLNINNTVKTYNFSYRNLAYTYLILFDGKKRVSSSNFLGIIYTTKNNAPAPQHVIHRIIKKFKNYLLKNNIFNL